MFDYISQRDPASTIFYCGCVPFGLAWALHQSLGTGFALQAYLVTTAVFIVDPFEMRKDVVKQRWFWRIMLRAGAVVHPLLLIGLWFLDSTYPIFVTGTGTVFLNALVVSIIEIVILGEVVDRSRPADQEPRNS